MTHDVIDLKYKYLEELNEDKFANIGTKNLKWIETLGHPRENLNGEYKTAENRDETRIRVVLIVGKELLIRFVQDNHNNK